MQNLHHQEAFPRVQPRTKPRGDWNREKRLQGVHERAAKHAIQLTKQHLEAIEFVLDFYEYCEDCRNARQLMKVMDQEFSDKGGKKYLYKLFPKGPLSQIHDLTDLPDLRNQVDKGFGTSY